MTTNPKVKYSLTLVFVLTVLFPKQSMTEEGPSEQTMKQVEHSVVQIIARECSDQKTRTGSGFLWSTSQLAVTALHVISGCKSITAHTLENGDIEAQPTHQLINADLVLLQLKARVSAVPLQVNPSDPVVNETLQAIGYYYGVPSLDNKRLWVTIGKAQLQDMLTDTLRQELARAGSPDPAIRIVRMDGHLLPGLSGAPIINASGRVVGIGSGGLADGSAGVSWAIASSYLKDLPTGPLVGGAASQPAIRPKIFFSTEEGFAGVKRSCGELEFVRLRSGSVGELSKSSDNPLGFLQLTSTSGLPPERLSEMGLDVYVNPGSGASVAVPSGANLDSDNDMCHISLAHGKYQIWIASARANSPTEVQQTTMGWELSWSKKLPLTWVMNPNFSYTQPLVRQSDGLTVNRKTLAGYDLLTPKGEAFETLMYRGTSVVGVIVMNREFNPPLYQRCAASPEAAGCAEVNTDYVQWAAAISGTFLSTFPPQ